MAEVNNLKLMKMPNEHFATITHKIALLHVSADPAR